MLILTEEQYLQSQEVLSRMIPALDFYQYIFIQGMSAAPLLFIYIQSFAKGYLFLYHHHENVTGKGDSAAKV